jgi:hypothetical protein
MTTGEVEQALKALAGLSWRSIGRAADLVWLQFGQLRQVPAALGGTKWVGEWALHLQCPWNFDLDGKEFLCSKDILLDRDGKPLVSPPDGPFGSKFDDEAWMLNQSLGRNAPWVTSIAVEDFGFSLDFKDQRKLAVIAEGRGELWRLFRPSTDHPHFVVAR